MTTNDQAATTLDTIIAIQSALATEPPISADLRASPTVLRPSHGNDERSDQ